MEKVIVEGRTYTERSDESDLETLLLQHLGLDRINDQAIVLSDLQFVAVKSWLLKQTEEAMQPGNYTAIEHGIPGMNGGPSEVVFARGLKVDGEAFIWHEPLPWPDDWSKERLNVRPPSFWEVTEVDGQIIVRYAHMTARFDKAQTEELISILRNSDSAVVGEPETARFINGELEIRNYGDHLNLSFERTDSIESLSTSLRKENLAPIISGLEKAVGAQI